MNGIINIYKEKGFTSHDVVAKLRGIMKQKKIGHTGTLDPEATGVLPVCLGNATKLCDMLVEKEKEYIATVCLGVSTDTQDLTGNVLKKAEVKVKEEEIRKALGEYVGSYEQIPPMFSAIKINGKKLYELAREGKEIERKPRQVFIYEIELLQVNLPYFKMWVRCSKGTYIRTLCHDVGEKLGCYAAMAELERTKSGQFALDTALKISEVEKLMEEYREKSDEKLLSFLIPVDSLFMTMPEIIIPESLEKLIYNGNPFPANKIKLPKWETFSLHLQDGEKKQQVRIYLNNNKFTGIYEFREKEGKFYPVKMFLEG